MDSRKINELLGSKYIYEYRVIEELPDDDLAKYIARTRQKFVEIAKFFDDNQNTEWLIRNYLALKYILAATVFATSSDYAREHNLRITIPYLNYYMMFLCCRSFIFSSPFHEWRSDKSLVMTHQKVINIASDELSNINKEIGEDIKLQIESAKAQRELFSYRFPASGFYTSGFAPESLESAVKISQLLADLTQLNSSCLQASIDRHGKPPYSFDAGLVKQHTVVYDTSPERPYDDEDNHRINYYIRKMDRPYSIFFLGTEGLIEDFFGAWIDEDESREGESYNPDCDWRVLFSAQ